MHSKPQAFLKWHDEDPRPINRATAAATIRKNRRADPALRVTVRRVCRETFIVSTFLNVGCCIFTEKKS